jgi:hypothetical protein
MTSVFITEIESLATLLVGAEGGATNVAHLLHWLGCRGSAFGLVERFELLENLLPDLDLLVKLHPNFEPARSRVISALALQTRLSNLAQSRRLSVGRATNFEEASLSNTPLQEWSHEESRAILVGAVLLDLVWGPYQHLGNEKLSQALAFLSQLKNELPQGVLYPSKFGDRDALGSGQSNGQWGAAPSRSSPPSIAAITIDVCLDKLHAACKLRSLEKGLKRADKEIINARLQGCENLKSLMSHTTLDLECLPSISDPIFKRKWPQVPAPSLEAQFESEPEREWGDRATIDLTDRQLLGEYATALTPAMRQNLGRLLGPSDAQWSHLCTGPNSDFESISGYVLRIALLTGQLLDDAATTPVLSHERLIQLTQGHSVTRGAISFEWSDSEKSHRKYYWNPAGSMPRLDLELLWPPQWPDHCIDFIVGDLLPLPYEHLLPAIRDCVANTIGRTEPTSRLFIKHALGRELFGFNTNRAVIRHVCGDGDVHAEAEYFPKRSSLHHYVTSECSAVSNAYKVAQARLLQKDEVIATPGFLATHTPKSACIVINPDRMGQLFGTLGGKVQKTGAQDPISLHNHFVQYVSLILLMCTGHRETRQLFHFVFSLNLKEALAFIADKQRSGSEARFVPLPNTAVQQVKAYLNHILWLIAQLELQNNPLADNIRRACGLSSTAENPTPETAGLLFKIYGGRLVSVSTDSLAKSLRRIENRPLIPQQKEDAISARSLRRNLATYLGNRNESGDAISFFLGHNGNLNQWGAGSCQVPEMRLQQMRPLLEEYLEANQAALVNATWAHRFSGKFVPQLPSFAIGNQAYEGRRLAAVSSSARAKAAIQKVVDIEDLEERGVAVIDTAVLEEIREEIHFQLGNDFEARDKVLIELAKLVDRWRRSARIRTSAAQINLTRFRPGPIDISFGRHFAIAQYAVDNINSAIKSYLPASGASSIQRLAVVALLLVVTEAVMNRDDLEALLNAVQQDGITSFAGQIRIRAQVKSRHAMYERTCDLTDKCASAVIGYQKTRGAEAVILWTAIAREIEKLVECLFDARAQCSWEELMLAMRPYWILRLPGVVFACCVGEFDTSAECQSSAQSLLCNVVTTTEAQPTRVRRAPLQLEEAVKLASQVMRDLLSATQGSHTNHTANKRRQRMELRRYLSPQVLDDLTACASDQPIVEIWTDFLRHLLEEGGLRVKTLAHGTIEEYQRRAVDAVFKSAWDFDFNDFDATDFDAFYERVYADIPDEDVAGCTTVLKTFHEFLRDHIGAPRCKRFPSGKRRVRIARNVVFSKSIIDHALHLAHCDGGKKTKFNDAGAGLIAINAKWGLRTMEGIGLQHRDFNFSSYSELLVTRNSTRSIKSRHGRRRMVLGLSGQRLFTEVNTIFAVNAKYGSSPTGKTSVFADPENRQLLLNEDGIRSVAAWALKTSSENLDAIVYSLRHTWATSALTEFLIDVPKSPIAKQLLQSLPKLDERELTNLLPAPANYSLATDRIAMWLGHGSIDQVIPTYGHCIWWIGSDYCNRAADRSPWDDETVARLIGVARTSIQHHRTKAGESVPLNEQLHAVTAYYIKAAAIPPISRPSQAKRAKTKSLDATDPVRLRPIKFIETFFGMRHSDGLDFPELATRLTKDHGMPMAQAVSLINAYVSVRDETEFTDFEPVSQKSGRDARHGVLQRQLIRRDFLGAIERSFKKDPGAQLVAASMARQWAQSVEQHTPLLISHDPRQLQQAVAWLRSFGYANCDLAVRFFHYPESDIHTLKMVEYNFEKCTKRLSRLDHVIPMPEFL